MRKQRNVPVERLIRIPAAISDEIATSLMVKGFTASLVINRVCRPKPGDTILIHTAASGVGLLLTQWSKHLGATVIGTVGSREKAELRSGTAATTRSSTARPISSRR